MNVKTIITACYSGISLFMASQTGFAQVPVTNLRADLAAQLPKNYNLMDCGFKSSKSDSIWWVCEAYQLSEDRSLPSESLAWLLPIENDGVFGKGFMVHTGAGTPGYEVLLEAWAQTSVLVTNQESQIVALALPASSDQNPSSLKQLWQYVPPKSLNPQENLVLVSATSDPDGGYVLLLQDYIADAAEKKQDRLTTVRLTGEGKEVWQYSYATEALTGYPADDEIPDPKKRLFLTDDQKTVIYGETYQLSDVSGTFLICLDAKGQEISHQFYKDYYWDSHINNINQGFGFINYPDEDDHTTGLSISPFNKDCQKMPDQALNLPTHGLKGEIYNQIKTTSLTAKGDLVIVYTQQAASAEGEEVDLPPPSMYVGKINSKGEVIQEIPLITGEDENRHYLEVFMDEGGYDYLKTTLVILPQSNEVLISIHNMGTDPEDYPDLKPDFWLPRIYKVKLP